PNYSTGVAPGTVAVADFNRDGIPDLAVANRGGTTTGDHQGTVSILLGKGDGTFRVAVDYAAGTNSSAVAVGDFNGDGIPDLVVGNGTAIGSSDNVSVLLGNGDGTFQAAVNYAVGSLPIFVTVGDLNGDGNLDLAVANGGSNTVSVLLGNGDGTFQMAKNLPVGTTPQTVAIGDFNGDGIPDL